MVKRSNRCRRLALGLASILLLPACGGTVAAPPAATGNDALPLGVSPGFGFERKFERMSAAQRHATIELMKADGVRWLRLDYYPSSSFDDAFIASAQHVEIQVDAVLEDFDATPPQFAAFATESVEKLRPLGVGTYEILNEVNLAKPAIPARKYVPLLRAAYEAIQAADPQATVLMSGLGPGPKAQMPATYLGAMYSAGAKPYFDAANLHPYSYPDFPEPKRCAAWNAFCNGAPAMREVMIRYGDGAKRIWFTEFGCPTGTAGGYPAACTDATLARQIAQAYRQASSWRWVKMLSIFSWRDDALDGDFGLYRASGKPKPHVVATFKELTGLSIQPSGA